MRLAHMRCGRGFGKIRDRHGAEVNFEGVHVGSTFLSRSWLGVTETYKRFILILGLVSAQGFTIDQHKD